MPLVFVHGVNVRVNAAFQQQVVQQAQMFAKVTLRGLATDPNVTHPYWGHLAADPAWNNQSVPDGDYESFGADDEIALILEESAAGWPEENPLLEIAATDFSRSVDVLWTLLPDESASAELAELGAKTVAYADSNPIPDWLSAITNDQQFLTQLAISVDAWQPTGSAGVATPESAAWESFGAADVWGSIREGASRLIGLPARSAGAAVVAATRSKANRFLSRFIGDILVYLDSRGTKAEPGPIPQIVINALKQADQARTPGDPHLVVVGHSMGGNILYDILTHYEPAMAVDALVTVGSQVGMFEELKLFHVSDPDMPHNPGQRVPIPANIGHWINVFDRQDLLSFVANAVFDSVDDFDYSTGATALGAHTSYFKRPSFHKRLNERLSEVLS